MVEVVAELLQSASQKKSRKFDPKEFYTEGVCAMSPQNVRRHKVRLTGNTMETLLRSAAQVLLFTRARFPGSQCRKCGVASKLFALFSHHKLAL